MKKADTLHRFLAKIIDFLLVGGLCWVPGVGFLAGALYILISDGFFQGRSVGKKLIGLRTVLTPSVEGAPIACDFKSSMIRNLLFSVVVLVGYIPILQFILFPIGVLAIGVEAYFVYFDALGIRIGDIFSNTAVVDDGPGDLA